MFSVGLLMKTATRTKIRGADDPTMMAAFLEGAVLFARWVGVGKDP